MFHQELRRLGNLPKEYSWIQIHFYLNFKFILFPLCSTFFFRLNKFQLIIYYYTVSKESQNYKLLINLICLYNMIFLYKGISEYILRGFIIILLWNCKILEHLNIKFHGHMLSNLLKLSHLSYIFYLLFHLFNLLFYLYTLHFQYKF